MRTRLAPSSASMGWSSSVTRVVGGSSPGNHATTRDPRASIHDSPGTSSSHKALTMRQRARAARA
jgi:hypothetical protein